MGCEGPRDVLQGKHTAPTTTVCGTSEGQRSKFSGKVELRPCVRMNRPIPTLNQ